MTEFSWLPSAQEIRYVEREETVSRVTFAILPLAPEQSLRRGSQKSWLTTQKCSATRPVGRENTHFPSSCIPTSPLSYSLLHLLSFIHADNISVQPNKHLLSAFSVTYL